MPYLYLFIEKYKNSSLKEISRFASGLERDLPAVEQAHCQMDLLKEQTVN